MLSFTRSPPPCIWTTPSAPTCLILPAQPTHRRPNQGAGLPNPLQPGQGLQRALDAITAGPAFVRNGRMDVLAVNPLGKAFYADVFAAPGLGNLARFAFLDLERSRAFYP
jgi:hypothetical protein